MRLRSGATVGETSGEPEAQPSLEAGLGEPFELLALPDELTDAVLAKLRPEVLATFALASRSCRGAAFPPSQALARLSPRLSCGVASAGFAERAAERQTRELMGEDIQLLQQETWVSLLKLAGLKKQRGGEGAVTLS